VFIVLLAACSEIRNHAFGATARAEPAFFAGERYNLFFLARLALKAQKTVTEDSTLKILFEFLHDVIGNRPTFRLAIGKKRIELFLENTVARR
jgi:hypothetical protein